MEAPSGHGRAVALRYRDFRLLWLGQFVSTVGSQMFVVAIGYQIYDITRSPLSLGLLGLCRMVPLLIFALGAGVVADALDRRRLLLVSQVALLLLSIGLALWAGSTRAVVWPIYLVVALSSVARTFEQPARQAFIPALVPPEHLPNALSLNVLNWQAATVLGPSLAGIVIARFGVQTVYWLDAASFLAVIVALLLLRARPRIEGRGRVNLRAALEGLSFVRGEPIILSTMLLDFAATFFGSALTLLPLFAEDILNAGAVGLGLLYAAPSAGAVAAGLIMAAATNIRRQGTLLVWSVVAYGFCTVLFGLSTHLGVSLLALAGIGAADTVSTVIRNTIRQLRTPDALRGRMVSVNMLFFMGGPQLGEFEAGVVARLAGGPFSVWSGGLMCMVAVALIAWRVPQLRRYDGAIAVEDSRAT